MILPRYYDIKKYLKKNKALILYGPRRVGKTTIIKEFLKQTKLKYKFVIGDDIEVRQVLSCSSLKQLKEFVEGYQLLVIDEAQKINNIGENLKIIVDNIKDLYVIATGSSSFDLTDQVGEPLTGRKIILNLYPFSIIELKKTNNLYELKQKIEELLIYGGYPEIITAKTKEQKAIYLKELVNSYLLKDILELKKVKGAKFLIDLLRLIAFQIGSEVSLNELASNLAVDVKTIARYLDLFEKSFILYNLRGFSKNLRTEINKKSKYFFYDNGIRNAIISNFNNLDLRNDVGALWENFLVSERLKTQTYKKIVSNNYFWRTWEKKEIDWIEEREGKIFGYEFKFKKPKKTAFSLFKKVYRNSKLEIITKDNFLKFLL